MLKSLISEYTYDEIKTASRDNFEAKEIIPNGLLELRFDPLSVGGAGVPIDPAAIPEPEKDKMYILKHPIPIGNTKTIIFADPSKTPKGLENLKTHLNVDIGTKSIKDIFDLSGFDLSGYSLQFPSLEGLSATTLTEKFQELQKTIKEHLENISPFKK